MLFRLDIEVPDTLGSDEDPSPELARVLCLLAQRFDEDAVRASDLRAGLLVRDPLGNTVGSAHLLADEG